VNKEVFVMFRFISILVLTSIRSPVVTAYHILDEACLTSFLQTLRHDATFYHFKGVRFEEDAK
jgi:hypothetical protein